MQKLLNFFSHRAWVFLLCFGFVGYLCLTKDLLLYDINGYLTTETCKPIDKLGFLKLHKCASTTIQNIILRYAYFNEKNIVLPKGRNNYLGQPDLFSVKMVEETPWHKLGYNFFTLHTRWNHQAVASLLGETAKYVTMVRNPVDVFESFYSYQKMHNFYNVTLDEFINKLKDRHFKLNVAERRMHGFVGRNQMVWDFGLKPKFFENEEAVDKLIDFIDTNFNLVMIAERFEESMILFQSLTCWSYEEISYLKLNARLESRKVSLTDQQREILGEWLSADMRLYKYFQNKFEEKVEEFGRERMDREIETLLNVNGKVEQRCVEKIVTNKELQGSQKWYSDTVFSYKVKEDPADPTCRLYGIKENTFIDELQDIQRKRALATNETRRLN